MIYIIGTGYYSDWNIVGYMEDGNEAANYVAEMNKKVKERNGYSWERYWYMEAEKITADMEKKEWWVRYTYRILEWANGNKSEQHFPNEAYTIDEDNYLTDKYEEPKYVVNKRDRELTMTIRANVSAEKALKICRDEMARQRAEREGL